MSNQTKIIPISCESEVLASLNNYGFCLVNDLASECIISHVLEQSSIIFSAPQGSLRNSFVRNGSHRYISFTLLVEGTIPILTNSHLLEIARNYCGSKVHLSNHRIYQNLPTTTKDSPMNWHKDNKLDYFDANSEIQSKMVPDDKGLIIILFLNDVKAGGTQLALNTHEYMNSQEVFLNLPQGVEIFTANNLKAGTALLYDYRIIHRAQPVSDPLYNRISLFGQLSSEAMPKGEPIVMNSHSLKCLTEIQQYFLNTSYSPSCDNWPQHKAVSPNEFYSIISSSSRRFDKLISKLYKIFNK